MADIRFWMSDIHFWMSISVSDIHFWNLCLTFIFESDIHFCVWHSFLKCLTFIFEMDIQFHLCIFNSKNHAGCLTSIFLDFWMSDLKMDVQLVQFGCQSVPKMSDIHFWSKMDVSELNFFMMFHQHLHIVLNQKIDIFWTFPLTFAGNPVDFWHQHSQGSELISVWNLNLPCCFVFIEFLRNWLFQGFSTPWVGCM